MNEKDHRLQIGLMARSVEGELENKESEKCYEWRWFDLDNLPDPLFIGYEAQIRGMIKDADILIENQ